MAITTTVGEARLQELSRELDTWRSTQKRPGRRIPEEYWTRAARLAGEFGLRKVHKLLRLQYTDLKRRVERIEARGPMPRPRPTPTIPQATFVELRAAVVSGFEGCTLEVESGRGARLRVLVPKATPADLAAVLRDFVG